MHMEIGITLLPTSLASITRSSTGLHEGPYQERPLISRESCHLRCSWVWLRWSGLRTQQSGLDGGCRVMPDRHRRVHAQEAELAVETFGPGVGVQDDLLVPLGQRHEPP